MKSEKLNISVLPLCGVHVNKKYKDRLFCMAFREKQDLMDLYNAVNGTTYNNPEDLMITTMEDAVYLGMKNDVSFLLGSTMNLYEHQSTFNPNMPLRGLLYFSSIIKNYVDEHELNIYGRKKLKLPLPQYIVFYNGLENEPDRKELFLSDLFENGENSYLECKVLMLNINYGHNQELMSKCQRLEEYAYFVERVRSYVRDGYSLEEAVHFAVDECIKAGKLADILSKNREEVVDMLLTDFDLERYGEMQRRDGEEAFANLTKILLNQDRIDDLQRAIENPEYREDLYKEFEI